MDHIHNDNLLEAPLLLNIFSGLPFARPLFDIIDDLNQVITNFLNLIIFSLINIF